MTSGLPLNIDYQQILLHMFNFVILVGGLYILLYKPVKDFMENRIEHYKAQDSVLDSALKKANEEARKYEEKVANAESEADEIKAKAMTEAKEAANKKLAAAEAEAQSIIAAAKARGEKEYEKIVASAKTEIVALATQAAAKILDENEDMYESFSKSAK